MDYVIVIVAGAIIGIGIMSIMEISFVDTKEQKRKFRKQGVTLLLVATIMLVLFALFLY